MESNIFKIIDHGGERLDLVTVGDREFMQHLKDINLPLGMQKGTY